MVISRAAAWSPSCCWCSGHSAGGRQTPERRLGGLQDGVWGREPEEEGGSSGLPGLLQVYPEQKEKVRGAYARPTPGGRAASGG